MREYLRKPFWVVLAVLAIFAAGCYPSGSRSVEDYDILGVRKLPGVDFTDYQTFAVIDTIVYITDDENADIPSRENQQILLNEIRTNMINYGYQQVDVAVDTPDLAIFTTVLVTEQQGIIWWDYWGWYGGWYPWYPCYYPYCGGGWYPYSYEQGTLAMEMLDVYSYNPSDSSVSVVWTALANGVLSTSSNTNINLAKNAINQAFEISPYLDIN